MADKAARAKAKVLASKAKGPTPKPAKKAATTPKPAKTAQKEPEENTKPEPAPEGHNSGGHSPNARKALKGLVAQIEAYEEEKRELTLDIKDVYTHAKDTGFDVKTIRKVVSLRKQDKTTRDEAQELVDTYMFTLGDR